MAKLFALFLIVPLVELWCLVQLGGIIGASPTVGLVVLTALVGAFLAKREGRRVWDSWQRALRLGQPPSDGVVSTLLLVVGSVLLVTPGLFTDVIGFALLIPGSRRPIAKILSDYLQRSAFFQVQNGMPFTTHTAYGAGFSPHNPEEEIVIEAEVVSPKEPAMRNGAKPEG